MAVLTQNRSFSHHPALMTTGITESKFRTNPNHLVELTHLEIAEALEVAIGTVKSRLSYGLAALRSELGRREPARLGGSPAPGPNAAAESTL
jgi:hypothetical protein